MGRKAEDYLHVDRLRQQSDFSSSGRSKRLPTISDFTSLREMELDSDQYVRCVFIIEVVSCIYVRTYRFWFFLV